MLTGVAVSHMSSVSMSLLMTASFKDAARFLTDPFTILSSCSLCDDVMVCALVGTLYDGDGK